MRKQLHNLTWVEHFKQVLDQSGPPQQLLVVIIEMTTWWFHASHFEKVQMARYKFRQLFYVVADFEFNVAQHDGISDHSDLPNLQIFQEVKLLLGYFRKFVFDYVVGICVLGLFIPWKDLTEKCQFERITNSFLDAIGLFQVFYYFFVLSVVIFF